MRMRFQLLTACRLKRRRRLAACAFAAACVLPTAAQAQALATLERALLPQQDVMIKSGTVDGTFWESLAFLRAEEDRQRAIRGNVTFGMTGDSSGPRSLFKLNTGVGLSRGVFPAEFTVDTFLSLQLANGQVQEDVTSLKISYDYHTTKSLQYFAFAERFSDNFLSIAQRYEVGFGARLGASFGRIGDWRETDRHLNNFRRNLAGARAVAAKLPALAQVRLQPTAIFDEERFAKTLDNLDQMMRDRQERLFVGIAVSAFAEVEQAAIDAMSSPISPASGAAAVRVKTSLDGTHRYRLNIRPTIRFRASPQVSFRVYPYWKLPIDGPRQVTLRNGERRLDYRRDVLSDMTWSLQPGETGLEGVDFIFTFNHFFDNAPPMLPQRVIDDAAAAGRVFDRLIAEEGHRFVSMSLRVRW
jgi:hypothetical protein